MPLLVHCPNNCQFRLPSNRTGKVVRCAECQTPIRIPEIASPLLRTGNWVECRARLAIKKTDQNNDTHDTANQNPLLTPPIQADPQANDSAVTSTPDAVSPLEPPPQNARLLRAKPWRMVEPLTSVDPEACLTPIDLESPQTSASPTMPSQFQKSSAANSELNQKKPSVDDAGPDGWLSTLRKLLWYETPAADTSTTEEPPKSV